MYEELITALRTCVDKERGCSDCPYNQKCMNNTSGKHVAMVDAADAIERFIEVIQNHDFLERLIKPRWIPVTERLPDDLRDVQITVFWHGAWRTMYGYYDGSFWHLYAPMHTEVADVEVIGWMEKPAPMPLPEPPKE